MQVIYKLYVEIALADEIVIKASKIYREEFLEELKESFRESLEGKTVSLEELEEKVLGKKATQA